DALARRRRVLPGVVLLLGGDGPERARVEALCRRLGVDAVFTGTVSHVDVPAYIAAMDAAVLHAGATPFHYSPLKLWEYMACGKAVVAPRVGQLDELLTDGSEALLVPPEDPSAMAVALQDV